MTESCDLSKVADQLRRCGDAFLSLADALADKPCGGELCGGEKEEPPLTYVDVRMVLAEKAESGFDDEVRALVMKHGAKRLSKVKPEEYAVLLAEVEALGNG